MMFETKTPKVTVVVPTYNSERFIGQTVASILSQSYKNIELIVADDGSSDNTDEIISRYGNRLRYIKKRHEGISLARNAAIAAAKGDYIAFIDHDDIWFPEKLQEQVALLEGDRETYLCFSDTYIIDKEGRRLGNLFRINRPHRGMVFKQLLKENFIPVITAVVRKKVFQEIGLFDPRYKIAEDWDLFLRISKRYRIDYIDRPLAGYRIHAESFSRQRALMCAEAADIIDKYIGFVDKMTAVMLKLKRLRLKFDQAKIYLHRKAI